MLSSNHFKRSLFIVLLLLGVVSITNKVSAQDEGSSLNIRNDVIYNGEQDIKEFDYYGGDMDLFLEESTAQNRALQKREADRLDAIDKRLFHSDIVGISATNEVTISSSLFAEDYTFPEVIVLAQEEETSGWKIISWISLVLGAVLILVIGWLLGRRYFNVFSRSKGWL